MANAVIDENDVKGLIAASSADGKTPTRVYANPSTHRLLIDTGASSATATTWTATGQSTTVTNATVTSSSIVMFMCATPPKGFWGVVCGVGSFVITSSDSESAGFAFTYKVFA